MNEPQINTEKCAQCGYGYAPGVRLVDLAYRCRECGAAVPRPEIILDPDHVGWATLSKRSPAHPPEDATQSGRTTAEAIADEGTDHKSYAQPPEEPFDMEEGFAGARMERTAQPPEEETT